MSKYSSFDRSISIQPQKFPMQQASCNNSYGSPHSPNLAVQHAKQQHQKLLREMRDAARPR